MEKKIRNFVSLFLVTFIPMMFAHASGTVSVGESVSSADSSAITIPIHLNTSEDLSCFSVNLGYAEHLSLDKESITINEARFPWNSRSVMISVNDEKKEIVFTVADLIGQNTMVSSGEGLLLAINGTTSDGESASPGIAITNVTAFDTHGAPVELNF